jgi:RNA binding exosome subunit
MKMIHNIKFRAFVYEDESVDDVSQAILNILPEAEIEAEEAEGWIYSHAVLQDVRGVRFRLLRMEGQAA